MDGPFIKLVPFLKAEIHRLLLPRCACLPFRAPIILLADFFRLGSYPFDSDLPEEKENYARLQMRTIAHEIGHVICGYGHPDEKAGNCGPAPLVGTNHDQRLMRSGSRDAILKGNRLVKGEWDAAEIWLKTTVDPNNQQ
jgi:hypothetical protein